MLPRMLIAATVVVLGWFCRNIALFAHSSSTPAVQPNMPLSQSPTKIIAATLPITPEQLHDAFWKNPNVYHEFLVDLGEENVEVESWSSAPRSVASAIDKDSDAHWQPLTKKATGAFTRVVKFTHRPPFTPFVAITTKTQTLRTCSDGSVVVDEQTAVAGGPFCDSFVVLQRLRLGRQSGSLTRVEGWVRVRFVPDAVAPRGRIEKGAISDCRVLQEAHARVASLVATSALELTGAHGEQTARSSEQPAGVANTVQLRTPLPWQCRLRKWVTRVVLTSAAARLVATRALGFGESQFGCPPPV